MIALQGLSNQREMCLQLFLARESIDINSL